MIPSDTACAVASTVMLVCNITCKPSCRRRKAASVAARAPAIAGALAVTLSALRRRHEGLQAMLQTNMTVLATAHAVSEGIIRGVSSEIARRHTPSTYGAGGRANAPNPRASRPIALSRAI